MIAGVLAVMAAGCRLKYETSVPTASVMCVVLDDGALRLDYFAAGHPPSRIMICVGEELSSADEHPCGYSRHCVWRAMRTRLSFDYEPWDDSGVQLRNLRWKGRWLPLQGSTDRPVIRRTVRSLEAGLVPRGSRR